MRRILGGAAAARRGLCGVADKGDSAAASLSRTLRGASENPSGASREARAAEYWKQRAWTVDVLLREQPPDDRPPWISEDARFDDALVPLVRSGALLVHAANSTKEFVGMITEHDCLLKLALAKSSVVDVDAEVGHFMSRKDKLNVLTPEDNFYQVFEMFQKTKLGHLTVVASRDDKSQALGIVSARKALVHAREFHESSVLYLTSMIEFPVW